MIRLLILALVLMSGSTVALADGGLSPKDVGFVLDVVSATDATGTPIASYLQKMARLGDKWGDVETTYHPVIRGKYFDTFVFFNNGCMLSPPTTSPCRMARLVVTVEGTIGSPAIYRTEYSEREGTH